MGLLLSQQTHAACCEPDAKEQQAINQHRDQDDPFEMLALIPDHIDAAVVLNNPAEQFLLNDTGRSVRVALGFTGLFGQTMGAFDALAKAFDADTEATIRELLSRRTVIVWDEIDPDADSLFNFANAIDSKWAVLSEIDRGYLNELRKRLKPVKRRLAHGQVVYAIEQGRYELILLEGNKDRAPMVLLAPSKGSALLDRTLAIQLHREHQQTNDTFLDEHHVLTQTLGRQHPQWLAAWLIHNDRMLGLSRRAELQRAHLSATAGVLLLDGQEAVISMASDLVAPDSMGDAPVGLLSAAGEDAILAVALAQIPSIVIESDLVSAFYGNNADGQAQQHISSGENQSGLLMLTQGADQANEHDSTGSTVLTMLVEIDRKSQGQAQDQTHDDHGLAHRVDELVHGLFVKGNAEHGPNYLGRFPNAVRTHHFSSAGTQDHESGEDTSAKLNRSVWPGDEPKFSWISAHHRSMDAVIASIGPASVDTADRVKWMKGAIESLDAIPDQATRTGVISSGYFCPSRASDLLSSGSGLDLAISKLFERIEWDITRMEAGVRGTVRVKFTRFENMSNLGASNQD